MKILFISSNKVFPVKDGVDLPLARFMQELSNKHEVALLRTYSDNERKAELIAGERPSFISSYYFLPVKIRGGVKKLIQEFFGIKPFYFIDEIVNEEEWNVFNSVQFDWIWISPEGLLGIAEILKEKYFPKAKFALGINEPQYTVFQNKVRNYLKGREPFSPSVLISAVRLPLIYFHEKRYLKKASLVHVQTNLEKSRLEKMLGKNYADIVVVAPNGIKEELLPLQYHSETMNRILLVTAMDGSVKESVDVFLENVWLKYQKQFPNVKLILVGRSPNEEYRKFLMSYPNVEVLGFVTTYADAFLGADIALLPLFQNHGLINRVVDTLCAGVPMIGFTDALQTVDNLKNKEHAFTAKNWTELEQYLYELSSSATLRNKVSSSAKLLASSRPNWNKSAEIIETKILNK